jgi:RNA polymerase-binding transcription factor DksA
MTSHDAERARLEARLEQLLHRVDRIEGDLRATHDRDWQERAIELENDEVLEGLDEMSRAAVTRIRAALERIRNGTYGICVRCGGRIAHGRLAAVPDVTTCLKCAA